MAQNTDDYLRSRGFTIYPHESDQVVRNCTNCGFHGRDVATAVDYGTADYGVGGCWAIFDALAPLAYGPNRIVEELAFGHRAIDGGRDVAAWRDHGDHVHSALVPGRLLPVAGGSPIEMLDEITDISEFQTPGFGIGRDGTIVRACNGRREDHEVDAHVRVVRAAGSPLSLYAYCEPGVREPEFTADLLIRVARRNAIPGSVTLWADIEEGDGDLRWYEERFVAHVYRAGWRCGVYSGDFFWGAHNLGGAMGKWVANYGSNNGSVSREPGRPWDIHQYTSYPNLDKNRALRTTRDRLFATGAPPPKPKGSKMFAVHLTEHPDYPQGGLFVGLPGAWLPADLQGYARALQEGHFQVTVNGIQWDRWNKQERLDGAGRITRTSTADQVSGNAWMLGQIGDAVEAW